MKARPAGAGIARRVLPAILRTQSAAVVPSVGFALSKSLSQTGVAFGLSTSTIEIVPAPPVTFARTVAVAASSTTSRAASGDACGVTDNAMGHA